jgi:hypothetical protein
MPHICCLYPIYNIKLLYVAYIPSIYIIYYIILLLILSLYIHIYISHEYSSCITLVSNITSHYPAYFPVKSQTWMVVYHDLSHHTPLLSPLYPYIPCWSAGTIFHDSFDACLSKFILLVVIASPRKIEKQNPKIVHYIYIVYMVIIYIYI